MMCCLRVVVVCCWLVCVFDVCRGWSEVCCLLCDDC